MKCWIRHCWYCKLISSELKLRRVLYVESIRLKTVISSFFELRTFKNDNQMLENTKQLTHREQLKDSAPIKTKKLLKFLTIFSGGGFWNKLNETNAQVQFA